METIGLRELRQNASAYMERVRSGETISVTVRGELIGDIVPQQKNARSRLIAEGALVPAQNPQPIWKLPPVQSIDSEKTLTELLLEMRAEERA